MDTTKSPHGVYKNPRLMHVCTTIVGFTVHLQTKDGQVWEGIFNTFSEEFTVCLDLAVPIDPRLDSKDCLYQALKSGLQAKRQVFFDLKDIVRITVVDVDLNYATKELDKITTDADISGFNSSKLGETRELESWQDDDGDNPIDDSLLSLDEVASASKNGSQNSSRTGWDPTEMFRYNEKVHKVSTTYDDELQDYTIALPKHGKNDRDWRKKQERAAAIAREIENNPQSQGRIAKEDGSDNEEEKYSAVIRPTPNQPQQQQTMNTQPEQNQQSQHHQPLQQTPHPQQSSLMQPQQHQHQHQHQHLHHPQSSHQHPNQHPQSLHHHHHPQAQSQRQLPNRSINNGTQNKNFRNPRYDRRLDSLKNFGKSLTLAPSPRPPQGSVNQMQGSPNNSQNQSSSPQQSHQPKQAKQLPLPSQHQQQSQAPTQLLSQPQQSQQHQQNQPQQQHQHQHQQHQHQQQQQQQQQHQQHQQHQQQPQQQQLAQQQTQVPNQHKSPHSIQNQQPALKLPNPPSQQQMKTTTAPTTSTATATTPTVDTSVASDRSDAGSSLSSSQAKDQSEIARKSKLNPNAKEFVYKPRSPAIPAAQTNGANAVTSGAIDPTNPSPMSQATHGYYQQVSIFPHGLSPHQQPHHATQFMPNHAHMHAFHQSQIHYMPTPMAPHFAPQQMSPRYIRSNFQNYHHRGGEHLSNVRAPYSQASMVAPTSVAGQQYVPPHSGAAPHPMSGYATASPQQQMIYSGPPHTVYPMVAPPSGFPQHMPHVPPPTYDANAVYMQASQNYVVNPQQ